jgi:hypothetical protein
MGFGIIKLIFGGLIKKIIAAATGAFRWITQSTVHLLIAALIAALAWGGWQRWGWAKSERENASLKIDVANGVKLRELDRANYAKAQADAQAAQEASDLAISERYSALAKESDNEHSNSLKSVRRASDSYFSANRLRGNQAACSPASSTGPAPVPVDQPSPDRPGAKSGMVGLTKEDFDTLTGAALQAAERGNYLQALIDDGYALVIPDVEFGGEP